MKKLFLLIALLGFGGMAYGVADYVQVGWNMFQKESRVWIPVGVEIERMGLSLSQLDAEIESNSRQIVEESVALDRFAQSVEEKHQGLTAIKSDLSLLKTRYVDTACDKKKDMLAKSMLQQVARFKSQATAAASMEKALNHKRGVLEKMRIAVEKQMLTRDELKNRLDVLRADYESLKMQGALAEGELVNSAVHRATKLASEIEDRLEVQRRLADQSEESFSLADEGDLAEFQEKIDLSAVEDILDETLKKQVGL